MVNKRVEPHAGGITQLGNAIARDYIGFLRSGSEISKNFIGQGAVGRDAKQIRITRVGDACFYCSSKSLISLVVNNADLGMLVKVLVKQSRAVIMTAIIHDNHFK